MLSDDLKVTPNQPTLTTIARRNLFDRIRYTNPTFIILLAGFVLRLVILPVTYQPWDMPALAWSARVFALGNWNIYDTGLHMWLEAGYKGGPSDGSPISHGPLFYYLYGAWMWLLGILNLFPLKNWTDPYKPDTLTAINLVFLKFPHIIFDLIGGWFLSRIFDGKQRLLVLGLWVFCPLNIYISYLIWQDDICMTSLMCIALYYAAKALKETPNPAALIGKSATISMVFLGLSICFKIFPIFFLIPFALILSKRINETILDGYKRAFTLLGFGLAPVLIMFVPQILLTKQFLSSVLFSNEANGLTNSNFSSGVGTLSWYWLLYIGLLAYLLLASSKSQRFGLSDLISYLSLISLAFVILNRFPASFLMWLLPIIILMVGQQLALYWGYLIVTTFFVFALQYYPLWLGVEGFWYSRDPEGLRYQSIPNFLGKVLNWSQFLTYLICIFIVTVISIFLLYIRDTRPEVFFFSKLKYFNATEKVTKFNLVLRIFVPFCLFFGLLSGLFFLAVNDAGAYRIPLATTQGIDPLTPLSQGNQVVQGFVAPLGKLKNIELQLNNTASFSLAKIEFKLYKGKFNGGELVYSTIIDALNLKNTYYSVKLPNPIQLDTITSMNFVITSLEGSPGNSPNLLAAPSALITPALPGTPNAIYNGSETNKIVIFKVGYEVDWFGKGQIINDFLNRTPLFSAIYYIVCLALGLALLFLLTLRVSTKHKAKTETPGKPNLANSA